MADQIIDNRRSLDLIPHVVQDDKVYVSLPQYLEIVKALEQTEHILQKVKNSGIDVDRFLTSRLAREKPVQQTAS